MRNLLALALCFIAGPTFANEESRCLAGVLESCHHLAFGYERELRWDLALPLYERNCQQGYAKSCHNLGVRAEDLGKNERALSWWDRACTLGFLDSCYNAGLLNMSRGEARRAKAYFRKVCDGGDPKGCNALGRACDLDGDPEAAVARYRSSCDRGSPHACALLAYHPLFHRAHPAQALALFARACEGGAACGCFPLAWALELLGLILLGALGDRLLARRSPSHPDALICVDIALPPLTRLVLMGLWPAVLTAVSYATLSQAPPAALAVLTCSRAGALFWKGFGLFALGLAGWLFSLRRLPSCLVVTRSEVVLEFRGGGSRRFPLEQAWNVRLFTFSEALHTSQAGRKLWYLGTRRGLLLVTEEGESYFVRVPAPEVLLLRITKLREAATSLAA